jgi:hypothetical protein
MIYRNIEKLVLDTPNNMELGEKLRELYWKEREENDRDLDIWYVDNIHDIPSIVRTTIKGSYKDELPPSDYQLDN